MIGVDKAYLPIKIVMIFLLLTELFIFLGPIDFSIEYPFVLILFLMLMNISLYYGYKVGVSNYQRTKSVICLDSPKALKIVKVLLIISAIMFIPRLYVGWNLAGFSFSTVLAKFILALNTPDVVYKDFVESSSVSPLRFLVILWSPFQFLVIPCGIYYYKKLSKFYRVLVLFAISFDVILCIGKGIRKNILDTIIIVVFSCLASNYKINKRVKFLSFVLGVISISGLLYYFLYSNLARFGTDDYSLVSFGKVKEWYINNTSPIFYSTFSSIHFYLCHAYKNLSLALNHTILYFDMDDFIFTFGLGNNSFTLTMLDKYFDIDLSQHTYQYLLFRNYNVPIGVQWQTIYPWIANDFTFLGCPIILYFIGKLYARFWMDCRTSGNFYSIAMLSYFSIMIIYFFANNQVLSFSFIPFWVMVFLYVKNIK